LSEVINEVTNDYKWAGNETTIVEIPENVEYKNGMGKMGKGRTTTFLDWTWGYFNTLDGVDRG
jgi:hypothetical protein